MKKVALTLASVLAAAAFAPEASAIPAFARQTGMACSACHFQKFPVLNGFGRAFKANGYTMMGAQEKVEAEHLSIPSTLNAAILFKYRYVQDTKTNQSAAAGEGTTAATSTKSGQWQMGDEYSLFFGGRIAETEHMTIGFLSENNLAANTTPVAAIGNAHMPTAAGLRVPINFDLGAAKISVVPFTTDGLGAQYGFELSSGGIMRANRWAESRAETSAMQYIHGDAGTASGTAIVVHNDMGFINYTKFSSSFAPGAGGGWVPSTNFGQSYIRVAATPNVAGFDMLVGGGVMSGTSFGNLSATETETKLSFFDLQAQGQLAGMEASLYVQNATAAACTTAGVTCEYNGGGITAKDITASTIGGEVSVIPHALTVGAAYRSATTNANKSDNAITLTAVYDLVQNVALHVDYSMYSGDVADATGGKKTRFLGMLEAAW